MNFLVALQFHINVGLLLLVSVYLFLFTMKSVNILFEHGQKIDMSDGLNINLKTYFLNNN